MDAPPSPAALRDRAPTERSIYAWLREHGGADYRESDLHLDVQGRLDPAVAIVGLDVEVIARRKTTANTLVHYPTGGAFDRDVLLVDLDAASPRAVAASTNDSLELIPRDGSDFFESRAVHVSRSQPWSARLIARSESSDVTWRVQLRLLVGRRSVSVVVDDHGRPFRTVGRPYDEFGHYVNWAWYETPQRFLETDPDGLPLD